MFFILRGMNFSSQRCQKRKQTKVKNALILSQLKELLKLRSGVLKFHLKRMEDVKRILISHTVIEKGQ